MAQVSQLSHINKPGPIFWQAMNQIVYPTPIVSLSEPGWTDGNGLSQDQKFPVYEDGKYYLVGNAICKYIRHYDGSGYLENNPKFWSGHYSYTPVFDGTTITLIPYYKPA